MPACFVLTLVAQCVFANKVPAAERPTWQISTPLGSVAQPVKKETPPNILLMIVDDLGYGDLSCYGGQDIRTPNIDQLVASGLKWNRFYASSSVCSPTRASVLTGCYPEIVGVPGVIRTHADNSWGSLSQDAPLIPEMLAAKSYQSAIVGKWHLGLKPEDQPTRRGFDHFHGFLGDMMDDYYTHRRHGENYMRRQEQVIDPKGHATDLFTQWACDFLKERDRDRPFFMYLAYNAPHTPIQPPPDWVERVREREPRMDGRRAKLVALIEHLDAGIGEVMQTLRETGASNDTLIIFVSDNGGDLGPGANNGALRDGKQSMYEGGLRVPCAWVWPGQISPGSETEELASVIDIAPTLCDVAGVELPTHVDGISLRQVWEESGKQARLPDRDLFFHRREGGQRYGGMIIHAIRRGDWKLLKNSPFAPYELYQLADDPLETNNLADSHPDKVRELSAALRRQLQRGGAVPWQPKERRFLDQP